MHASPCGSHEWCSFKVLGWTTPKRPLDEDRDDDVKGRRSAWATCNDSMFLAGEYTRMRPPCPARSASSFCRCAVSTGSVPASSSNVPVHTMLTLGVIGSQDGNPETSIAARAFIPAAEIGPPEGLPWVVEWRVFFGVRCTLSCKTRTLHKAGLRPFDKFFHGRAR